MQAVQQVTTTTMPTFPDEDARSSASSKRLEPGHLNAKPQTVNNVFFKTAKLGHELLQAKKYREAMCCCRAAFLCKSKADMDAESRDVQTVFADLLVDIGVLLMTNEEFSDNERAMEVLHSCIELRRATEGPDDPLVADALYRLAYLYTTNGDLQYACELLLEALSILLSISQPNQRSLKATWTALGRVQESLGDISDAKSSLREASKLA